MPFGTPLSLGSHHGDHTLSEHSACKTPSPLYTIVISIVAVTARSLIASLFPVNCLNLSL